MSADRSASADATIEEILSATKRIEQKLSEVLDQRHQIANISETIKQEIIEKILKSGLNISVIPDAIESRIYKIILDILFQYFPSKAA